MEASTNLIGGQPFSMENFKNVRKIADKYKIMIVLDASLIGENAYFIKKREAGYEEKTIGYISERDVRFVGYCIFFRP